MWSIEYGLFHDLWNSIRQSAKYCQAGVIWNSILKFTRLANMNHGPYGSGCWGSSKQTALKDWLEKHTEDHEIWDELGPILSASYCVPFSSRHDIAQLRELMASLPSCTSSGPVLKLARW